MCVFTCYRSANKSELDVT